MGNCYHGEGSSIRGTQVQPQLPATPPHHKILFQETFSFKPRNSEIGLSISHLLHLQIPYSTNSPVTPASSPNSPFSTQFLRPRSFCPTTDSFSVFAPSTVKTLGSLMGNQLLHIRPGELQMLCPQEAPKVLARLQAVRRMLGVRTLAFLTPSGNVG